MSNRVIVEKPTGKEKQKAPYKRQQLFFVHLLCIFFAVRAGIGDDCSLGSVNECSGVRVCVWGKGVVDKPPVPSDAGKKEKKKPIKRNSVSSKFPHRREIIDLAVCVHNVYVYSDLWALARFYPPPPLLPVANGI